MDVLSTVVSRDEVIKFCKLLNKRGITCHLLPCESDCTNLIYLDNQIITSRILSCMFRYYVKNVIIFGPTGVGKTSFVHYLAQSYDKLINSKKFSWSDLHFITINVSGVLSGTKYRGELEDKVVFLFESIKAVRNLIIFIDEAHTLIYTSSEWGIGIMDIIKSYTFESSQIRFILSTTQDGLDLMKVDTAFMRRFEAIEIASLTSPQKIEVLKKHISFLSDYHGISDDFDIDTVNLDQPLYSLINDIDFSLSHKVLSRLS